MKRAIAIFLILASLIAFVKAADVPVTVGSDTDQLMFTPQTVMANLGDNIVFTWAGKIPHSVIESDEAKSCVKSKKTDAFTSGGQLTAPKTWTYTPKAAGKTWFYCGVGTHCSQGMYGTLIVADGAANGTTPSGSATPSGTMMPTGSMSNMPNMPSGTGSGSTPSGTGSGTAGSSASRNYAAGFVVSSMCMVAALML